MIAFFSGMRFLDILACITGTIAFVVAAICIVKLYILENKNGTESKKSKSR